MKNLQNTITQRRRAQFIFVVLPTIAVAGFFLWQANSFFSILRNQWLMQLVYFAAGLIIGNVLYAGRVRFLTSFAVLLGVFYLIYQFVDNMSLGEFDAFF